MCKKLFASYVFAAPEKKRMYHIMQNLRKNSIIANTNSLK